MKSSIIVLLVAVGFSASGQKMHKDYSARIKDPTFIQCRVVFPGNDTVPALMTNYREAYKRYGTKGGKINVILSTKGKSSLKAEYIKGYELKLRNGKRQFYRSIGGQIVRVRAKGERIVLFEREEMVINTFGIPDHALMVSINVRKRFFVRKKYEAFLTDVDEIAEKEALADYFKECPGIVKQIEQNRLKARSIVSIVQKYNNCQDFIGEE